MTKRQTLNTAMIVLVLFALAGLAYFGGLTHKYSDVEPAAGTTSNVNESERENPPGTAQFKADCTLASGQKITGTVSLEQTQNPQTLDVIEVKTDNGPVRFGKNDGTCQYAPY